MVDPNSPYDPPTEPSDRRLPMGVRLGGIATLGFVFLPIVGGTIGFVAYIALALAVESQIERSESQPVLSYGQFAALISLPLCTLILAAVGFATAFALIRRVRTSISALVVVCLLGAGITCLFWVAQVRRYGRDPSEYVLFLPPLICSFSALVVAAIVALASTALRRKNIT